MKYLAPVTLMFSLVLFSSGCSEQTKQEAREAGQAIEKTVESAAQDTRENTETAVEAVKEKTSEAVETAREEVHEATAPDSTPPDEDQ